MKLLTTKRLVLLPILFAFLWLLLPTSVTAQTCTAVNLPLTESITANSIPNCWGTSGNVSTSTTCYGASGYSVQLSNTASSDAFFITPMLHASAYEMEMSFWAYGAVGTTFSVGVLLDASDPSTLVPIVSDLMITSSYVWQQFFVPTAACGMADVDLSLAVYVEASDISKALYVDEFSIEVISCQRPSVVTVTNVASTSATLAWVENSYATAWEVMLVNGSDISYQNISSNPYTLTGLEANTSYSVGVRAKCSSSDNSGWSSLVSFKTPCTTLVTPYSENFESLTAGIPDCWDNSLGTTTTDSYKWNYYNEGNNTCVRFDSQDNGSGNTNLLQTPQIQVAAADMLNFEYKNGTAGSMSVGVSTDGGANVTNLVTLYNDHAVWDEYSYSLAAYAGQTVTIVFTGVSNYGDMGSYIYLDNVSIAPAPTCARPKSLSVTRATSNGAIVYITDTVADAWQLAVGATGFRIDTVTSYINSSNHTTTITGLQPETTYDIYVRANCGSTDGVSTWRGPVTFTTACPVRSLPYSEDFDSYTSGVGNVPNCWTMINAETANDWSYPACYVYAGNVYDYYGVSGNYLNFVSSGTIPVYAVLPQFAHDIKDIMVSFTYRNDFAEDMRGTLSIGYMSNPNDTSTFVHVATFGKTATLTEIEQSFADVAVSGQDYYIAFHYTALYDGYSLGIDNLSVSTIPTCMRPQALSVDAITSTGVTANITDPIGNAWQLAIGTEGFDVDTVTSYMDCTTKTMPITGLQPQTTYDVYVRANCGSVDGVSTWRGPVTFTTACSAFAVTADNAFIEGFEEGYTDGMAVLGCWTQGNLLDYYSVGTWVANSSSNFSNSYYNTSPRTGNYNAKLGYANTDWLFYRVQLQADVFYMFRVYARQNESDVSLASITMAYGLDATDEAMTNIVATQALTNGEYQMIGNTFSVAADGEYIIGIKGAAGYYPYISLDDISLSVSACPMPSGVSISAFTDTTATIAWQNIADSYNLKVFSHSVDYAGLDTITADIYSGNVGSVDMYQLQNLEPNTTYYYAVQCVCSGANGEWSVVNSFKTACSAIELPYSDSFEIGSTQYGCWTATGSGSATYSTNYSYDGSRSIACSSVRIATPQFDVATLTPYKISGYIYKDIADTVSFTIGVMSDVSDDATYIPIQQVALRQQDTWVEFTAYMTILDGMSAAKHITLSFLSENTIYIDNVVIEATPACPKVIEVVASNVTPTTASIDWEANSVTPWNVKVFAPNGSAVVDTVVTTHPITVAGLSSATVYNAVVYAVCAADDISVGSTPAVFTTECAIVTTPFVESFGTLTADIPLCWDNSLGIMSSWGECRWVYSLDNGNACLRFDSYNNMADNTNLLQTPELQIGTNDVLVFDYKNPYGGNMLVGVSTDNGITTTTIATLEQYADWTTLTYDMSAYAGQIVKVVFTGISNYNWYYDDAYLYLDNISVVPATTCTASATCSVSNVTTATADVVITDATATAWQLTVGEVGFNPYTATNIVNTTSLSTVISGLQANTKYELYVRANCGSEQSVWRGPVAFATECDAIELPYSDSFDNYTAGVGNLPDCWRSLNAQTGLYTYPQCYVSAGSAWEYFGVSGNYLNFTSSDMTPVYAVLPQFAHDINDVIVTFTYRNDWVDSYSYEYAGTLSIGYMSDPTDAATFVEVYTFEKTMTLTEVEQSFAGVAATGQNYHIAFRYSGAFGGYFLAIDNLSVEEIPACPRPQSLSVTSLGSDAVTLSVTDAVASAWQFAVGASGFSVDTVTSFIDSNTSTAVITGLQPQTNYDVYVRANCGSVDGVSEWRGPVSFTTTMIPVTLPYSTGFETDNDWMLINGSQTNIWMRGSAVAKAGNYSLYISNDGSTNGYDVYTTSTTWACKAFTLDAGQYAIGFNWKAVGDSYGWKAVGDSYGDYLRAFVVPGSMLPEAGSMALGNESSVNYNMTPDGAIALTDPTLDANYPARLNSQSTWQSLENVIDITAAGTYNVLFMWRNDDWSGATPAAIDEFYFEKITCPVLSAQIAELSDTAATLIWNADTVSAYQVMCLPATTILTEALVATAVTIADTTYQFTGLTAQTDYVAYVRAQCDVADFGRWTKVEFTTACGVMTTPFTENFNGMRTDIPTCWDNSLGTTTNDNYKWSYYSDMEGNECMMFNSYMNYFDNTNLLQTPRIELESSDMLSFSYMNPDGGNMYIGVSTDNGATVINIDTLSNYTTWTDFSYNLDNYVGQTVTIVFTGVSNYNYMAMTPYLYLDNVSVGCIGDSLTVNDTICEGTAYNANGFRYAAADLHLGMNTYSQFMHYENTCDTLVTLNLMVMPTSRNVVYDTICAGQTYNEYGFVEGLTTSNVYLNTLTAANGCDSIIELHLHVNQLTANVDTLVCASEGFYFGGEVLTVAGVYTDTVSNAQGCDSVTILTLSTIPTVETNVTMEIGVNELPWVYGDLTVPAGTAAGVASYDVTFTSVETGCDSIVHLELTIVAGSGLNLVSNDEFSILPNPIDRGGSVTVQYDFTAAQREGLTVSVMNMLGEVIQQFVPDTYPIQVRNFTVDGCYLIRVTTGTNQNMVGRVIVK